MGGECGEAVWRGRSSFYVYRKCFCLSPADFGFGGTTKDVGCCMTGLLIRIFIGNKDVRENTVRTSYVNLASVVGIVTNTCLFAIKLVIGLMLGSISIIADAANNITDSLTNLMVIIGIRLAKKPADAEHPFGHARIEYIISLIISALILFLGYELIRSSISQIINPTEIRFDWVLVGILVGSAFIKLWQSFFYKKLGKKINSDPLAALSKDSLNDVFVAVSIITSLVVIYVTGVNIDGFAGVIVSLLIMYTGFGMAKETISKLIGESTHHKQAEEIIKIVTAHEEVLSVHDLVVHSYGPGKYMPTLHVEMSDRLSLKEAHSIIDEIEKNAKEQLGLDLLLHIDPVSCGYHGVNKTRGEVIHFLKQIDERISVRDFSMSQGDKLTDIRFELDMPSDIGESRKNEIHGLVEKKVTDLSEKYNPKIRIGNPYTKKG